MIRLVCAMLMMVGGCSFKAGLGGTNGTNSANRSGPDSVRAAPSKNFTVPDLLFLPEAEARKALKGAGHTGSVSFAEGLCGSTLDNKIVDKGLLNNSAVQIGGGAFGSFSGAIDDVRIYDRALAPGEVTAIAASTIVE